MEVGHSRGSNRLANATSPYLLQHAHNPVDWYPWGEEALGRAKREDRPILLSVGYSACHWCHVMERESFENEAIARLMNEHFVCIKVDREERPDVDDLYMTATVALSGSGGWPMTVFLTPEQKPFFAGTYFPPTDRWGRPGFRTLLQRIAELWGRDRGRVVGQAEQLTELLRSQVPDTPDRPIDPSTIGEAIRLLTADHDPVHGGFGRAPKFPPSSALSLLLTRHEQNPDPEILRVVTHTLDKMHQGGMYDQLQGGFARYSTDEQWLVPHFEKMLYDNAQLAKVYLRAYQVTGEEVYRRVAVEVLDDVIGEFTSPDGGFTSALDADSEGEEGKYYVWTKAELEAILDPDELAGFSRYYGVTSEGNWEGKTLLTARRSRGEVAQSLGWTEDTLASVLERARAKAIAARKARVPPLLDDKILTGWNGLMIGAMATGFRVTRERRFLEAAEAAARYVLRVLVRPDKGLYRTARQGVAHIDAFLEDYAYLSDGLIDLYESGADRWWLNEARRLAERLHADFEDPGSGLYFTTARHAESLVVRRIAGIDDGATPPACAVAARAMARLGRHFEDATLRDRASHLLHAYSAPMARWPRAHTTALGLVDALGSTEVDVVVVGDRNDPRTESLWVELNRHPWPNLATLHILSGDSQDHAMETPLAQGRTLVGGKPAVYVCRWGTCGPPVTAPQDLGTALSWARGDGQPERKLDKGRETR